MYYTYLGGTQYKVIVKFYRDCRGIPFNSPTTQVSFGTNGGNACGTYALTATRISVRDVSQICSDSASPCNPMNSPSKEGVEEHVFEILVDISKAPFSTNLSNSSCNEATFSFGQCCRNGALTTITPGDFWVTSTIHFGNLKKTTKNYNSSPKFANLPIIYACCNQPVRISPGIVDTIDYDSMSYKLVHGIETLPNGSVTYNTPYSARFPMKPYCIPSSSVSCTPNPYSKPPRGFYFDTTSGDIIFTPTKCDEVGIIVVEVSEYRKDSSGKMVFIGKTRRDMQLIVSDKCGYNNPPELTSKKVFTACEGEKICFTIDATDEIFSPQQTTADTVKMTWNTNAKNATIKIVDPTAREKKVEFCWQTTVGDAKTTPYLFSVTANDNHCPIPSIQSISYGIKISACAGLKRTNVRVQQISISPNPASNYFIVKYNTSKSVDLMVTNLSGQTILVKKQYFSGDKITTEGWASGLYLVTCNIEGIQTAQKLIIQ